ncbi:multifunctional CCA addition/repair protein [Methylophilus sp. VKM B-3414]|uniref:multifunctional CCA addition/repair protein n=1 Tax=Methylophilus sp. VKM B-3414 TaxID=3076121 RepID=UPI0028CAB999|nr:multifunctional CCA addition/repair protein [Methylophilus sp. VKM B-3414]MDT7850461.1 multifunctional CCA addition/repair protein [Methylophilus sp. VKM B-3414]
MQIYQVGGAVRDSLLGLPVKDRDYVVVGASPEQMLAAGYRAVGKDFPVFLHPQTQQEYALARTERKTAKGYKGFSVHADPDVTLEEDLARRDFTINAIAQTAEGQLIDPFGGQADIEKRILRHVTAAFSEDPVRILRAARFLARFTDFTVAPETMVLMREMVAAGEVDALVPERVWQEIAKGLMESQPSRMFEMLRACGALKIIFPELDRLWGVPQTATYHPEVDTGIHIMMVIDYAATQAFSLPVRFAALTHDLGKGTTPAEVLPRHIGHELRSVDLIRDVVARLKVPNDCKDLSLVVAKYHGKLHAARQMKASTLLHFLEELDAFRQRSRFEDFLKACECDSRGRLGLEQCPLEDAEHLSRALQAALTVDAGAIAKQCQSPVQIKQAVAEARTQAIQQAMHLH